MSKGIIGIFKCEEKGEKWCSVSVRSYETVEELKNELQSEHPEIKLELAGAFSFEGSTETVAVEKKLRKLLVQAFGKYVPANKKWECYRADYNEVISFIDNALFLCKIITGFIKQVL